MTSFFASAVELDALLADFGKDLTFGATTVKALRKIEGIDLEGYGAPTGTRQSYLIRTGSLPGLDVEGTVTDVDAGEDLEVLKLKSLGDGAFTLLFCGEISS